MKTGTFIVPLIFVILSGLNVSAPIKSAKSDAEPLETDHSQLGSANKIGISPAAFAKETEPSQSSELERLWKQVEAEREKNPMFHQHLEELQKPLIENIR